MEYSNLESFRAKIVVVVLVIDSDLNKKTKNKSIESWISEEETEDTVRGDKIQV